MYYYVFSVFYLKSEIDWRTFEYVHICMEFSIMTWLRIRAAFSDAKFFHEFLYIRINARKMQNRIVIEIKKSSKVAGDIYVDR